VGRTIAAPNAVASVQPCTSAASVAAIDRQDIARSAMNSIIGTPLYGRMTSRNANTVRRLHAMLRE
jgi:uncharacterized protein (DUF1697 family)